MSGEINGSKVVVQNSTGEILGQGAFTHTFNGEPIDISNKSNGDWVTYLNGELSGKQHVLSGEMVFNNDETFRAVRDACFSGTQDTYTMTYVGSGDVQDEEISGQFVPTALSDDIPHGDSVKMSISFNSSGAVTRTPASDA